MTIKNRALAQLEIKVVVAIDVPEIGAAAALKIERGGRLHFPDAAVEPTIMDFVARENNRWDLVKVEDMTKILFLVVLPPWVAKYFSI
jgi:hypothetical protein